MATSTATNLALAGASGTLATPWFQSTTRMAPIGPVFVYWKPYRKGSSGENFPYFDVLTAAAWSEGDAAATPTAFPTLTNTGTVSPAGYRATTGSTSEGEDRVGEENDLAGEERALLIHAHQRAVSTLATVGLGAIFNSGGISQSAGTSGATLTYSDVDDAHQIVAAVAGGDIHTVTIINDWQKGQLLSNVGSKAAQAFSRDGAGNWVENVFRRSPYGQNGQYLGSTNGGLNHVFVEAKPGYLNTDSGDYIGSCFVPDYGALRRMASVLEVDIPESSSQVIPGFVGVAKENPVSRKGGEGKPRPEIVPAFPGTPLNVGIVERISDGQNEGVSDSWAYWTIGIGKATHCCKVVSTAS